MQGGKGMEQSEPAHGAAKLVPRTMNPEAGIRRRLSDASPIQKLLTHKKPQPVENQRLTDS